LVLTLFQLQMEWDMKVIDKINNETNMLSRCVMVSIRRKEVN
jgi:hypothetical protein